MDVQEQIEAYIASQPEPKQSDLRLLHRLIRQALPAGQLWFLDGKDGGKVVSNPNIGYGVYTITYAGGATRDFYQIGLSANTTGISVYVMGLKDKTYLAQNFGKQIGKASVTGYCIKFKSVQDINTDILQSAILYGVKTTGASG